MSPANEADKLSQVVLGSLEDAADAEQLARCACRSRAQFFRVFGALVEETPGSGGSRRWSTGISRTSWLEFAYGYGVLDRFNLRGATQFFQSRLQLQL